MHTLQFPVLRAARSAWFTALLATTCLNAATYYVSPGGNDANPGSNNQPFRSVQRGVSQAAPGDTILLGDGTYGNEGQISDGSGGMHGYASAVNISTAGAAGAWITLKAQNKGKAILDCGTTASALGCDKYINFGPSAAYWAIQDVVVLHGAWGGIGNDVGSSNIRITGCEIASIGNWNDPTQIGEAAIGFSSTASNWWIEGNVIHDIGRVPSVNNLDHGMYAEGSNITVINNVFYNIPGGWALQLANGASNWVIANNTFAFPNQAHGGGHIMLWNSNTNIAIRDNIFFNSLSSQSYAIQRYTSTINGCSVDHNLVYGAASVMSDTTGCTLSNNMMSADPKFVSTSAPFNFQLQPGSAAIGAGINLGTVTTDILGTLRSGGIDLGAYQFGSAASLQLTNTTSGSPTFAVGDGFTVSITGGAPAAPVALSMGSVAAVLGYTDQLGNFTASGNASAANIGTSTELWTVGGAIVNPNPVVITVNPNVIPIVGPILGISSPNSN